MYHFTKSLNSRSFHKQLFTKLKKFVRLQESLANAKNITLKVIKAPLIIPKTYIAKNEDLKRALSPHLTIYKPQISSMMSITVRLTGFAIGMMAWAVGITALISEQNVDYFVDELKKLDLDDCYWTGAKIIIAFPFAFHFVAGTRHLLFDTAKYLEKPQFYATAYAAIAAAFVLAICLGMMGDIRNKLDEMKTI